MKNEKTRLYYFLLRIPCVIISILICWFWHTLNYIFWYFLLLWAFLLFIYMVWIIFFSIPYIVIDWFLEKKNFRKKIKAWFNNGNNIDKVSWFVFTWILPLLFIFLVWYDVSRSGWWKLWSSSSDSSRRCVNVTSYDYNRNNDMKCTSSKWEVKYTSYEWAKKLMWK